MAKRRAEAGRHDRAILAALDLAGDEALPAAVLVAQTGLPERTMRGRIRSLRERGLVVRQGERGPLRITMEGRRHVLATGGGPLAALGAGLGTVLEVLPCEAYRAMVRLMLAAVVGRHHLRLRRPDASWPAFVAVGETGDGKTLLARIVCRMLGLAEPAHIAVVPRLSPGELVGRRMQQPGGAWQLQRPDVLRAPFLCLDEWDKAEAEVQRAAVTLMQGDAVLDLEGELVDLAPVPYATGNATYAELRSRMGDAYIGRALALDTRGLAGLLDDVDLVAAQLLAPGALPRLDLDRLVPPVDEVPPAWLRWLREALKGEPAPGVRLLTDRGRRLVRVEAIATLPLGLAALYPAELPTDTRIAMATSQVLLDYLTVASTVDGHAAIDWARSCGPVRDFLRTLAEESVLAAVVGLPDLAAGAADRARQTAAVRQRRVARDVQADELTRRRALLVATCREVRAAVEGRRTRTWPPAYRVQAAGPRAVLAKLQTEAGNAKSAQSLEDIARRMAEPVTAVDDLRRAVQAEHDAAEHERQRTRQHHRQAVMAIREEHSQMRDQQRTAAAAARAQQAEVRARRRDLEAWHNRRQTRPDESVPQRLVQEGLVSHHVASRAITVAPWPGARTLARALNRPEPQPQTRTERVDFYTDAAGRRHSARDLAAWESPATQAILEAEINLLHAAEDHLARVVANLRPARRPPGRSRSITSQTARQALPAGAFH